MVPRLVCAVRQVPLAGAIAALLAPFHVIAPARRRHHTLVWGWGQA